MIVVPGPTDALADAGRLYRDLSDRLTSLAVGAFVSKNWKQKPQTLAASYLADSARAGRVLAHGACRARGSGGYRAVGPSREPLLRDHVLFREMRAARGDRILPVAQERALLLLRRPVGDTP